MSLRYVRNVTAIDVIVSKWRRVLVNVYVEINYI